MLIVLLQIMGFAGYFHMTLYKDIYLSIVPDTFSRGMISWFPALIPLRELFRAKDKQEVGGGSILNSSHID